MTVSELTEYYASLLIIQYANKPKAKAMIKKVIEELVPFDAVTGELLVLELRDAFNIETAVGDQLDILDKYIGVGRNYDGSLLSDSDMRFLMKLKIIQNNSDHSIGSINEGIEAFFGTDLFMVTDGNMQMTYYIDGTLTTAIAAAVEKKILPVPMGVGVRVLRVDDYFGFDEYGVGVDAVRGFTDYSDIDADGSFLTYDDILA